jgi:uncharacterized SAM-binding protein YcdF (DUF218 family)
MFAFKKLVSMFLAPMPAALILAGVGIVLLWTGGQGKSLAGRILVTVGVVLLFTLSIRPVADSLLGPLERTCDPTAADRFDGDWIVVLGGGKPVHPDLPVTGKLTDATRGRLMEGILRHRRTPHARLIVTGRNVAPGMAVAAEALGVPKDRIVALNQPRDTREEAAAVAARVGDAPFLLITSAYHIPRARALFEKQGANPVPVCACHRVAPDEPFEMNDLVPRGHSLMKSERALHEYMGILWARFRGQI